VKTEEQLDMGAARPATATTKVSIIVPALNEARVIGQCFESLAALDFPKDQYEVILVDNGSKDDTVQIARSFTERMQLSVLERTGVRISGLRNWGAQHAKGDVVAFLDADCLAPRSWLNDIAALAPNNNLGVVGANYLLPDGSTWVGRTWHVYQEESKSGDVSHVPAGDLIMRRDDFLRVGGFDESIQTNEDYELCERVRVAGMPVRAFPELGVVHLGTAQSLKVFYRKQRWHGTHVVKVFLRDVFGSDNRNAVLFAAYSFACLAAIVGGLVWPAFGGSWALLALAVVALALPPALLTGRRILRSGRWEHFPALFTMYLTYGVARANALLRIREMR
jgi:glycosyltransferase involved in cell wall biosynthesis